MRGAAGERQPAAAKPPWYYKQIWQHFSQDRLAVAGVIIHSPGVGYGENRKK